MAENIEAQEGTEEIVEPDQQLDQGTEESNNNASTEDQYSDIELKALDMGWRPKKDFNGDDADFIPADEYVRLGDFADVKISSAAEFDLYGTLIK
jgi:ribosomal protein S12 methylthiotransferase